MKNFIKMEKNFEKDVFTVEITTEKRENGVSGVTCIKTFVKPVAGTKMKSNSKRICEIEECCRKTVKGFVNCSDLMSDNHIFDFSCTRENLNCDKWSRVRVDLYVFTPFVECEDELVQETAKLCEIMCDTMRIMFCETETFNLTISVP